MEDCQKPCFVNIIQCPLLPPCPESQPSHHRRQTGWSGIICPWQIHVAYLELPSYSLYVGKWLPGGHFQEGLCRNFPGEWSESDRPVVASILLLAILESGYKGY